MKHAISTFTIRRKTNEINDIISQFNLKIELKDSIHLTGDESKKRIYIFYLLNYVSDTLDNIPKFINAHHYKQLSLNVREQLGFNIPSHQIQSFTLWLFIMDYSIKSQHQLETLSSDDRNVVFQTIYPDKPESLSHWHLHEWYYFCLTNSINGVFNERSLID